jgi:hypothetical protein
VIGFAAGVLLIFASAPVHAGAGAVCKSTSGVDMHSGADGSDCLASSDGTGNAKASAKTSGSAQTFVTTGGKSNAVATGSGSAEAESESGGKSTAHASSSGSAFVDADNGGVATTTATGSGSGEATAFGNCVATSKASSSATANADCTTSGGFVHSTATNGGTAIGTDTAPPTCSPGGGTAKVRSSGGNC